MLDQVDYDNFNISLEVNGTPSQLNVYVMSISINPKTKLYHPNQNSIKLKPINYFFFIRIFTSKILNGTIKKSAFY